MPYLVPFEVGALRKLIYVQESSGRVRTWAVHMKVVRIIPTSGVRDKNASALRRRLKGQSRA